MWRLLLFVQLFLALGCDDAALLEHTRVLLQEMGAEDMGNGAEEEEQEERREEKEGEEEAECSSEPGEHQDSMECS